MAKDIRVHFQAVFKRDVYPKYLGSFAVPDLEPRESYTLQGATVEGDFIDWLKRSVPGYDPRRHGPSKLSIYAEYRDVNDRRWGGTDETNRKDGRGANRTAVNLTVE